MRLLCFWAVRVTKVHRRSCKCFLEPLSNHILNTNVACYFQNISFPFLTRFSHKKMFQHGSQSILSLATATLNLAALFGPSLSPGAEIFLRSDSQWSTQVTQRWTIHEAPSYAGAIKPATEEDIQNIVSK